jgi:hypothetical protein
MPGTPRVVRESTHCQLLQLPSVGHMREFLSVSVRSYHRSVLLDRR